LTSPFYNRRPPGAAPRATPRQNVLAEWRGVDLQPLEIAKTDRARGSNQVVARVLQQFGMERRRSEAELVKVWNSLIDPTITAHAQPAGIVRGTLFVNVDSSVWLNEIVRYRRKEILDRLQHSFGKELIVRISFRAC
jgi:predicted nucleic acid-binding Zn ribbon protein